jgi:hypothetical protein
MTADLEPDGSNGSRDSQSRLEYRRISRIIGAEGARSVGGMRQWFFGISALLFSCLATLGAVVISELHTEAGQPAPTTSYVWLWLGDVSVFAASAILLYFAIRQRKAN